MPPHLTLLTPPTPTPSPVVSLAAAAGRYPTPHGGPFELVSIAGKVISRKVISRT